MPPAVALLDLGTGNIASLQEAFAAIGARASLATTPQDLVAADALVLPGVGHFGPATAALGANGLGAELIRLVQAGLPSLGICLGFQLLTASSEEAPELPGLALLPDLTTVRIKPADPRRHKVPHLGWNTLESASGASVLLRGIPPAEQLFYFANAYAVAPTPDLVQPHALYSHDRLWLGLIQHGSLCGVQFHPEKSRRQGLQVLRNFLMLV